MHTMESTSWPEHLISKPIETLFLFCRFCGGLCKFVFCGRAL